MKSNFKPLRLIWKILRPVAVFLAAFILVMGLLSFVGNKIKDRWISPVDLHDNAEIAFTVESGDSLSKVSRKLEAQKLIRSSSFFKYYADFLGFSQKIQPGEYKLKKSMTVREIAEAVTAGDGNPIVRKITIIPGWNVEDIANYLVKQKVLKSGDLFLSMAKTAKSFSSYYYVDDIIKSGTLSSRKYALEGYLTPETYEIYSGASEEDIIKKLLAQNEAVFNEQLQQRAQELEMSLDQVLTLASLIEKEAKKQDFANVSAVFHNRLRKNMPLGSDVTIKYQLGIRRMVLTKQDLALDSPFNSYKNKGLPPGPICSPSPQAIIAALYPNEEFIQNEMLYFCSKNPDTGELHFSRSLKEHNQAVKVYSPLWQAFDEKNNK